MSYTASPAAPPEIVLGGGVGERAFYENNANRAAFNQPRIVNNAETVTQQGRVRYRSAPTSSEVMVPVLLRVPQDE